MKDMQKGVLLNTEGENIKLPSWIQWTGATTIGYVLGLTLSTYLISPMVRPLGTLLGGIINVLIYGAVIGISLGAFQFLALPRRLVSFHGWILASLAGSAIGFAVASVVSEALSNAEDPARNIVLGYGIIAFIAGGIIGFANGLGQWLALRRSIPGMRGWIMASTLGMILGSVIATALLGLFELPLLTLAPSSSLGAILGIIVGIFQGLVFRSKRRQTSR